MTITDNTRLTLAVCPALDAVTDAMDLLRRQWWALADSGADPTVAEWDELIANLGHVQTSIQRLQVYAETRSLNRALADGLQPEA